MDTIISLMNQIRNQELVLPAIQRNFVWREGKVLELIDSILRGYPIGLVLLWETYTDLQYRNFVKQFRSATPLSYSDNSQQRKLKLVLDGQQRLQSLYVALYGTYEAKSLYFDVLSGFEVKDLSDQRFLLDFLTAAGAKKLNGLPREQIDGDVPFLYVKTSRLFEMTGQDKREFIRAQSKKLKLSTEESDLVEDNMTRFDDEFSKDVNTIQVAVVDATLPPNAPNRKTEADVTEIFVRINSMGTTLSRSDLIFSMLKLSWKESAEALPEFVRSINEGNNLGIGTDFVIRCLFTVSDLGAKMNIDLLRRPANVALLQKNFAQCCDAVRAAVDFVTTECRCQSSVLLGGLDTMVPFVYYMFHVSKHEVPNRELENVRRSLYLFAFAKTFSRYGDSRISKFVRLYLKPSLEESGQPFPFEETVRFVKASDRIGTFDFSLLEKNHLLTLHLVQGLSGSKSQYSNNAPETDHIFPKKELFEREYDEADVNTVANYWILARGKNRNKSAQHPKKYFEGVADGVLQSALIDRELLDYRKYKRFLRLRQKALLEKVLKKIRWPT